ncbi:hypothetical protein KA107_01145 [Candidatus Pacearchaeota archaeon]|nr:hypothetical protein [Candidatus Pacearchaeota archaeon]
MRTYTYQIPATETIQITDYLENSNLCKVVEHEQLQFIFPGGKTKISLRNRDLKSLLLDVRTSRVYTSEKGLRKILRNTGAVLTGYNLEGKENLWLRYAVPAKKR